MGIWKHGRLVALLCAIALVLAPACGDDSDDDADTEAGDTGGGDGGDDGSDEPRGTLTVCSDTPYEPFEFEGEDGEQTGFDMELMREIADRMNMDMEVSDQPFDGIILAMQSGNCDIIASAMTITPERAENALFSDPYFEADQSLLVLSESAEDFASLEDLEGETIGVQSGTTGETYANENAPEGATIRDFTEEQDIFLPLTSGEIAAVLQDLPVNGYRAVQSDGEMEVVETYETEEEYGFATTLDNTDLIEQVNGALADMRDDGTYDDIYADWFGETPE